MSSKETEIKNGTAILMESLEDRKVLFPTDVTQIPDIIIYFADEAIENRRHSFARINPKDILNKPS
jgi:hypothetical protein